MHRSLTLTFVLLSLLFLLNACSTTQVPPDASERVEVSSVNGLTGHYFNNNTFEGEPVTRVDSEINFDWGDQAPMEGVSATGYSVRWMGQVQPDDTGSYTFSLDITGQARLLVNGVLATQVGWNHSSEQFSQPVDLQGGKKVDLTLEYKQGDASGSVIRLEYKQGGAASVVPSAQLSSTGSNLQSAINTLQADPTFSALGVQLDAENATGSLTPNGYGLIAQHSTETTYYIATLENDLESPVQSLYSLAIDVQGDATFNDFGTGRNIAIADIGSYVDENGNAMPEKREALKSSLFELLTGTSADGGMSGQMLRTQASAYNIPYCTSCRAQAEGLEEAYGDLASGLANAIGGLAGIAIPPSQGVLTWGLGTGVSARGVWGLTGSDDDVRDKAQQYLDCIAGNISGVQGCPPRISVTPTTISEELEVGQMKTIAATVTNEASSLSRLFYTVQRSGSIFVNFSTPEPSTHTLDPGQSEEVLHLLKCHGVGTFTGTTTITHNAGNEASPISIPVELICVAPITVTVSANPISLPAGGQSRLSATVRGDSQNLGVTWSVEGPGTIVERDSRVYYIAPLQNEGVEPIKVKVIATSRANSKIKGSREITVYPIRVSGYARRSTVSSGETTALYASVAQDASNQGVVWSLTGPGSLIEERGRYHYKADLENPAPNVTAEVTATSKADPGKSVTITITVSAIKVTAYAKRVSLASGEGTTLHARIYHDASAQGVTWSLEGAGTLNVDGATVGYKAPLESPAPGQEVQITATSNADLSKSFTFTVDIRAIKVSGYAKRKSVSSGELTSLHARIYNDASAQSVTWSLNGSGAIVEDSGLFYYKAPLVNPAPNREVEITATSNADPSKEYTFIITVNAIRVNAYAGDRSISSGNSTSLHSRIYSDASGQGVTWSLSGAGSLSGQQPFSGTYQGPTLSCHGVGMSARKVEATLRAKSVADPSKYKDFPVETWSRRCPTN